MRSAAINGTRFLREFFGLLFFFAACFLAISLFSYSGTDPTLNQQPGAAYQVQNLAGVAGAYTSGLLVDFWGLGAFVWPLACLWLAAALFWSALRCAWWKIISGLFLYVCLLTWCAHSFIADNITVQTIAGGGFIGSLLLRFLVHYLRFWGACLLQAFFTLVFLQLFVGFTWGGALGRVYGKFRDIVLMYKARYSRFSTRKENAEEKETGPSVLSSIFMQGNKRRQEPEEERKAGKQEEQSVTAAPAPAQPAPEKKEQDPRRAVKQKSDSTVPAQNAFPDMDLLAPVPKSKTSDSQNHLQTLADRVHECLQDFNIQGEVNNIVPGPVVTMFEFKPAPGVKISKIAGLSDDLALTLKAQAVRIVAPLPRKDTVGIEIPNEKRQTVYLREIFASPDFDRQHMDIPLALGKNIQGDPVVVDLARMPHLLVAGATGAGKSVCLNGLILSMLYTFGPDELKMLLVDPKRVELAVYRDLPHLVHPVVTDMGLTKSALDWAVQEMERRYDAMANLGVRHFLAYNEKLSSMGDERPEELADEKPLPYLVIIIDELADLMMTAAKEAEISIARLGQLARAAGIHLILATQRPSVDVVTGLIKANLPSRIAFQVSSKHDSRTILDAVGAEYLLGRGDMLYKQSGGALLRAHGAFVDDKEIKAVVNFWKEQATPEYLADFQELYEENNKSDFGTTNDGDSIVDDPKYEEAVEFVLDHGKASISMIQRRLRIGFNRAARFVEQMEEDGLIGPQDGSKPRSVIRK